VIKQALEYGRLARPFFCLKYSEAIMKQLLLFMMLNHEY